MSPSVLSPPGGKCPELSSGPHSGGLFCNKYYLRSESSEAEPETGTPVQVVSWGDAHGRRGMKGAGWGGGRHSPGLRVQPESAQPLPPGALAHEFPSRAGLTLRQRGSLLSLHHPHPTPLKSKAAECLWGRASSSLEQNCSGRAGPGILKSFGQGSLNSRRKAVLMPTGGRTVTRDSQSVVSSRIA